MKKFFVVLTVLIFALCVASCGGSGKKDDNNTGETGTDSDSDEIEDSDVTPDPTDSAAEETDEDSGGSTEPGDDSDSGSGEGGETDEDTGDTQNGTDEDPADSGDDSGDSQPDSDKDSDDDTAPGEMTEEELKKACQDKKTVGGVTYDCSIKKCQQFTFCDFGGKIGENTVEKCRDGADGDGDGLTDCKDPECQVYRFCNSDDRTPEEKACLDLIDVKGDKKAACADNKCKNFAGCADNGAGLCDLSKDPYKYEKGTCDCGWSRSKMLEDLNSNPESEDDFCAFNLDNENILQFASPLAQVDENPMPSNIILKTDIHLGTQQPWNMLNGLEDNGKRFSGFLDGNGKRIYGNLICSKDEHDCGLFARLVAATVKNLELKFTIKGPERTGALAGFSSSGEFGDIKSSAKVYAQNTTDYGNDDFSAVAGGIVGRANGSKFDNITLSGSVSAESGQSNSAALAGGVVGLTYYSSIENVRSSASVTASFNGSKDTTSVIKGCAGGLAGFITETARMENVEVNASIKADSQVEGTRIGAGGIVGCIADIIASASGTDGMVLVKNLSYSDESDYQDVTIVSAKSTGSVRVENTSVAAASGEGDEGDSDHDEIAGGIAGLIRSPKTESVITGAYSESNMGCQSSNGKNTSCTVGGIIGYARNKAILRSVSYKGKIETLSGSKNYVGGVAGYATLNSKIANASASGSITVKDGDSTKAAVFAGGIVGYAEQDSNFINTYNNIVIKKQFTSETASLTAGAVAGFGGNHTKFYESYWNPLTLPDESDVQIVGKSVSGIQVDATCHKYDKSGDHLIENEEVSPKLFDRLRYNIGVKIPAEGIEGIASPNLPYADDYRTWKTYSDSDGVLWPVIDLESEERFDGGSN